MLAASTRAGMDAATVWVTASDKEAASVNADAVAVVDTDTVVVTDMDAVAVAVPVRSDEALPIQNNLVCSRHLVVRCQEFVGAP